MPHDAKRLQAHREARAPVHEHYNADAPGLLPPFRRRTAMTVDIGAQRVVEILDRQQVLYALAGGYGANFSRCT